MREILDDNPLAAGQHRAVGLDALEEIQEGLLETALRRDREDAGFVDQLDVAHIGARDVNSGADDLIQQRRQVAVTRQPRADVVEP